VWAHGLSTCSGSSGGSSGGGSGDAARSEATAVAAAALWPDAFGDVEALRPLAPALVLEVCAQLAARSWLARRAGASAAAALCAALGSALNQVLVPPPPPLVAALQLALDQRQEALSLQTEATRPEMVSDNEAKAAQTATTEAEMEDGMEEDAPETASKNLKADNEAFPMEVSPEDVAAAAGDEGFSPPAPIAPPTSPLVSASVCLVRALALCVASQQRCWDGKHLVVASLASAVEACGAGSVLDSSAQASDWLIDPP
jgi:hypothetical protein